MMNEKQIAEEARKMVSSDFERAETLAAALAAALTEETGQTVFGVTRRIMDHADKMDDDGLFNFRLNRQTFVW